MLDDGALRPHKASWEMLQDRKRGTVVDFINHRELGGTSSYFDMFDSKRRQIYQKDVKGHFGCVNAIETSPDEHFITSGGDDLRVLVWRIADLQVKVNAKPIAIMKEKHCSNVFTVAFSNTCEKLYSSGNDGILLVHDVETCQLVSAFKNDSAVYHISVNTDNNKVIMSASEDGKVRLYDLRVEEEIVAVRGGGKMYCAQFNPRQNNLISVCNTYSGLSIYDIRKSFGSLSDLKNITGKSVMFGQWSEDGESIFTTCSRSTPVLHDLNHGGSISFTDPKYVNSCTVKSCSFISRDAVITGSDDWKIYIWKVPEDRESIGQVVEGAYRVLEGHRSIVNHARYSPKNRLLFSSGVEKIIKLWSLWDGNGFYSEPKRRSLIADNSVIDRVNEESVEEDLSMLAFFDLYVMGADDGSDGDDDDTNDEFLESGAGDDVAQFERIYDREISLSAPSSPDSSSLDELSEMDL